MEAAYRALPTRQPKISVLINKNSLLLIHVSALVGNEYGPRTRNRHVYTITGIHSHSTKHCKPFSTVPNTGQRPIAREQHTLPWPYLVKTQEAMPLTSSLRMQG